MASYNKIQDYVDQLCRGIHNWGSHTFKATLTNAATVNTNTIFANLTEITAQNGYSAGGPALDTVTPSETSGTAKVTIADEVITASGGSIGPFRYITIYNDTATSPADALVCWFDYGSSITLLTTETFTLDFDATNGLWQLV
jgi:hypothetical protein